MKKMKAILSLVCLCILSFFAVAMNVIPGSNCGISNPVRTVEKIEERDMSKDLGCTIVKDDESFRKYMRRNTMSFIEYIKKNKWTCTRTNQCKEGDACSNHNECGGAPGLACLSNKCTGVFGTWSSTESWSSCDVTNMYCGGTRNRTRTCTGIGMNPVCLGNATEVEACNTQSCLDCYDYNVDYHGFDLERILDVGSFKDCKWECQQNSQCMYYTLIESAKACFLKYERDPANAWSYPTFSGPKVCYGTCLTFNNNVEGTVLADKRFNTPEECQLDCYINRMHCTHFVFYTEGHANRTKHHLCTQFSSVNPNATFPENGCIFGPNHC